MNSKSWSGAVLIAIASFLWATDALFRYPAINKLDPTFLVFVEHILGVCILFPWVLKKFPGKVCALSPKEWAAAAFCGVAGSALGTLFFTASFMYVNPSVAVLIQKLQPVMVVIIAFIFLRERPSPKFYLWGTIAVAAGIVLSFPDFNFHFLSDESDLHSKGIRYAFLAALIWATSTVSGKVLVTRTPAVLATFWRFVFGLVAATFLIAFANIPVDWSVLQTQSGSFTLLYLSLVPGLLAMLIYYSGLTRTPASVTSFVELLYPIGAVILNTAFLHTPLSVTQTISGAILLIAVTVLSL